MQDLLPRDRSKRWLAALVAIGIVCRVVQYLWRRSYWHDESYLVLNIMNGSVRDAFGPLKLLQAAPPAFLLVQIGIAHLAGASEYALRFVPLVLGCASVAMAATLSYRLAGPFAACLATVMFATSDRLIWHSVECKQYSGDVFVALALLMLATRRLGLARFVGIALIASAAVWFSHTTMFVFGGISLVALAYAPFARTRRGLATYAGLNLAFVASVVALYVVSIRHQQYPEMYDYWGGDFVPWSRPLAIPPWLVVQTLDLTNYAYENAGPVICVTAIVGAIGWWRERDRRVLLMLTLPLALNFVASALHRFPFAGTRVTLYATPALFLLAAVGVERIVRGAATTRWSRAAWALPIALAAFGLTQAAYALVVPRHRGHARPAAEFVAAHRVGDEPIYVVGIVSPWQCYLTDPSIRWQSIPAPYAADIVDASFWTVFVSASRRDAARQAEAIALASRTATIVERFETVGSTAVRFERASPSPATRSAE